jgi:hypothetical protein
LIYLPAAIFSDAKITLTFGPTPVGKTETSSLPDESNATTSPASPAPVETTVASTCVNSVY